MIPVSYLRIVLMVYRAGLEKKPVKFSTRFKIVYDKDYHYDVLVSSWMGP